MDGPEQTSTSQIVALLCSILVCFASTIFFIPRNAILSRVGAAVALSCLQHSFYTSLLTSSLPPAQIAGISLFGWGLYANATEQILLSRYDADDVLTVKEKQSGRHLSTMAHFLRAVSMYFNLRRVGLRGEVSMKHRVLTNPLRFVTTRIVQCICCYLVLDAIFLAPRPEKHLITREKQSLFNLTSLTREDIIFRFASSLGNWVIGYVSVRLAHNFVAAVSVVLGLCKPEDWPHLNGPISSWSTVRTFWGTFWHRLFRKALASWGDFIPDKVLQLRRGTLLSRYSRLTLAFLASGLMHRCVHYFYRLESGERYEMETYFLLQPLAIMFEDAVQAATVDIPLPRPLRWIIGFAWFCIFTTWVSPSFLYPTMRVADPGQLLPFSVIGHLMKY
ncbi:TRI7-trichothecene biosynthesis [Fusarium pseudoanthophilum]|uniref:TRI7-trichothecene biosynthesis n=1 Tax=Fusarium pseudoanthophilum TaxID=48495 RepID=A0A8H5KZ02_9HYPO|nr:TRI7-trichothecene biosynthesis [Fusarium pseudoanthophilum]